MLSTKGARNVFLFFLLAETLNAVKEETSYATRV
jgi:hypothetical protein